MSKLLRLTSLFLAVLFILSAFTANTLVVFAKDAEVASVSASGTTGQCTWTLSGGVLTIKGNGYMADYNSYDYYPPWKYYDFTKVVISDGVKDIGEYAFYKFSTIRSVVVGNGVTTIGEGAFENCTYLSDLSLSDTVTTIKGYAFQFCASLRNLTLPDSVTDVEPHAFDFCDNLETVTLGKGFTREIMEMKHALECSSAFNSTSLENIYVSKDNPRYVSIDGVLYDKTTKRLAQCPPMKTTVNIPDWITTIGGCSFYRCSNITDIYIPDNITTIEMEAFMGCTSLNKVTIPSSVTSIGIRAFGYDVYDFAIYFWPDIDITICGYEGSAAERYADENGIEFERVLIEHTLDIQWGRDNFSFVNSYSDLPVVRDENGNYEYDLDHSWIDGLDFLPNDKLAMKNHLDNFGGACFGMSVVAYRNATNLIDIDFLQKGKKTLYQLSKPTEKDAENLKLAIGLYQASVASSKYHGERDKFINLSTKEKLKILYDKLINIEETQRPIVIDFAWVAGNNGELNAHAVLAYSIENNQAPYVINGETYEYKVWVIDPNFSFNRNTSIAEASNHCLYLKQDLSGFCIPQGGTRADTQQPYALVSDNGDMSNLGDATLQFVTDDEDVLPAKESDSKKYIIESSTQAAVVNGNLISGYRGDDQSISSRAFTPSGNSATMSLVIKENYYPTVKTVSDNQTIGVMNDKEAFYVTADKNSTIDMSGDEFTFSNSEGEYIIKFASNLNGEEYDDIVITGNGKQELTVSVTDEGLLLEGTKLDGTTISTEDDTITLNTTEDKVLVQEENDELIDPDNDILLGDVDGDGEVTIMDATEVQLAVAKVITLSEDRNRCADADRDGETTIMDATQIQKFVARVITQL